MDSEFKVGDMVRRSRSWAEWSNNLNRTGTAYDWIQQRGIIVEVVVDSVKYQITYRVDWLSTDRFKTTLGMGDGWAADELELVPSYELANEAT